MIAGRMEESVLRSIKVGGRDFFQAERAVQRSRE